VKGASDAITGIKSQQSRTCPQQWPREVLALSERVPACQAEILQAYFAVPQPSQRAVAQRLHCKQPYICKLFRKIRREGPEKAIGWEAYEHYKALRDAERTKRHDALVAGSQRSQGQTPPPTEPGSQGNSVSGDARHGSSADAGVKPAQQEGPTEYVELARDTNGNVIEIRDATRPPSAAVRPNDRRLPRSAGIPTYRIWTPERERVDDLLRMWAGITGSNRGNSWFPNGF